MLNNLNLIENNIINDLLYNNNTKVNNLNIDFNNLLNDDEQPNNFNINSIIAGNVSEQEKQDQLIENLTLIPSFINNHNDIISLSDIYNNFSYGKDKQALEQKDEIKEENGLIDTNYIVCLNNNLMFINNATQPLNITVEPPSRTILSSTLSSTNFVEPIILSENANINVNHFNQLNENNESQIKIDINDSELLLSQYDKDVNVEEIISDHTKLNYTNLNDHHALPEVDLTKILVEHDDKIVKEEEINENNLQNQQEQGKFNIAEFDKENYTSKDIKNLKINQLAGQYIDNKPNNAASGLSKEFEQEFSQERNSNQAGKQDELERKPSHFTQDVFQDSLLTQDSLLSRNDDEANINKIFNLAQVKDEHNIIDPFEKIKISLSKAIESKDDKIIVQLEPAHLGKVEINLNINEHHEGKLSIIVEKSETLELLRNDISILEKSLNEIGIKTESASLELNLRGDDSNHQQKNEQFIAYENLQENAAQHNVDQHKIIKDIKYFNNSQRLDISV